MKKILKKPIFTTVGALSLPNYIRAIAQLNSDKRIC